MIFIKFFRNIFYWLDRPPRIIGNSERLSRYIFNISSFKTSAKHHLESTAFLPNPKKDNTVSVYRTDKCDEDKVWWLSDRFVTRFMVARKQSIARADINASYVLANPQLKLESCTRPHPRHANVSGWPSEKPAQKLIALKILQSAKIVIR